MRIVWWVYLDVSVDIDIDGRISSFVIRLR